MIAKFAKNMKSRFRVLYIIITGMRMREFFPPPLERPGIGKYAWDKRMMQAAGEKRREKDRKQSEKASSWPCYHESARAR